LDVARNTGHNMGHLGVVPGKGGGGPLMLDVARNMIATWLAMAHNMLATWVTALFDPTVDGLSCFKSNGHGGVRC
jgi:hypothetical protein